MRTPDYVRANRAAWNGFAPRYVANAERNWAGEPVWGIWGIPDAEARILPSALEGKAVPEDGCGTGYVSAWLARRGARPVGIDNSSSQLATARRLRETHGLAIPFVQGIAEQLPFPDASFDLVISEYGAAIWADPYLWIPEAARVLRPGGELIFLGNSTLLMLCMHDDENIPAGQELRRPCFGMHRFEWPGDPAVEFHLSSGDWIRLLRGNGFEITELLELRPPAGAKTTYGFVDLEWARKWPSEEVWKARKRPGPKAR
jgi:SAM-dependent methyltransferase